jgi:hypothetical protein
VNGITAHQPRTIHGKARRRLGGSTSGRNLEERPGKSAANALNGDELAMPICTAGGPIPEKETRWQLRCASSTWR